MSACVCVNDNDYDGPSVIRGSWPVARKQHQCCECGDAIEPGQKYERVVGCWDGRWDTFATCEICVRIIDDLCGGGREFGGLRNAIWDCIGVDYITGEIWEPNAFAKGWL